MYSNFCESFNAEATWPKSTGLPRPYISHGIKPKSVTDQMKALNEYILVLVFHFLVILVYLDSEIQ